MSWAVTLGRIDVMFAANTLTRYSYAPHHGHLQTLLRAFGHLRHHSKGEIKFDTQILEDIEEKKLNEGLKYLYPLVKEKIPKDSPTPKVSA